jgi:vacuolar protein sorting-associated protein 26
MSFFGFGSSCAVDIEFKDQEKLLQVAQKNENGEEEKLFLFTGSDTIQGNVHVKLNKSKKVEHIGMKIELIGHIELLYDRGNPYEFTSLVRELEPPGELTEDKSYAFEFANVEKHHESYSGSNVKLRYFLRVKITRQYSSNITKSVDFAVQNLGSEPEINNPIKMEVGIEDCLHIEFEYNKAKYHLQDVVIGKIYFLLVRIKIKHMEVVIIKRESTGSGQNLFNESENIAKFEIMDGAPVRGESIPIRLFLSPYELTPTFKSVHNKFSVKYYLNLVLVDEEDRRYFKQQEIHMWRKTLKPLRAADDNAGTLDS